MKTHLLDIMDAITMELFFDGWITIIDVDEYKKSKQTRNHTQMGGHSYMKM